MNTISIYEPNATPAYAKIEESRLKAIGKVRLSGDQDDERGGTVYEDYETDNYYILADGASGQGEEGAYVMLDLNGSHYYEQQAKALIEAR